MTKLTSFALLLLAANLNAQEAEEQAAEIDQKIDPITAEVFADDIVVPDTPGPDLPDNVITEHDPGPEPESDREPMHAAPSLDQTVPVAEDDAATDAATVVTDDDAPGVEDFSGPDAMTVQLPPDATPEEELIYQYERYLMLMKDRVYDEADSSAKRVIELAITVKGPRSPEFARALTNLAIVQHRTGQYDAARQNFQDAIEIIENNEDRLDAALVNPLRGLGASQLESGRPDLAGPTFRRAVHVTHVNEGPHNLDQLSILESLAESNLRLGSVDDAKHIQDIIYSLNERAYADNAVAMIPSLMRRASWQHRAGFINDQRTSLRRVVRIIEIEYGKEDLRLVEPLTRLGQSYFYMDLSGTPSYANNSMSTGEIHFKRALRIASENPDAYWEMIAETSLALGDYYMFQGNEQRARKVYQAAWHDLGDGDERLAYRGKYLEQFVVLREQPIPEHVSAPTPAPSGQQPVPLLQGSITVEYRVSSRGRATNLKIIEAQPEAFVDMQRYVQRELRTRIYRPRFVEAQPVNTDNLILIHNFFYQQADLDALQNPAAAGTDKT